MGVLGAGHHLFAVQQGLAAGPKPISRAGKIRLCAGANRMGSFLRAFFLAVEARPRQRKERAVPHSTRPRPRALHQSGVD